VGESISAALRGGVDQRERLLVPGAVRARKYMSGLVPGAGGCPSFDLAMKTRWSPASSSWVMLHSAWAIVVAVQPTAWRCWRVATTLWNLSGSLEAKRLARSPRPATIVDHELLRVAQRG